MTEFQFAHFQGFASPELLQVSERVQQIWDGVRYKSNYTNVRSISSRELETENVLAELGVRIHEQLAQLAGKTNLSLDKLWLVKSTCVDTDQNKLPYTPHFDRTRYLKGMVYLNEVTLEHGPIHFGELKRPGSIEPRRQKLPDDYKERGLNEIVKDEVVGEYRPIVGHPGDVVFFDTNSAHYAGIVHGSNVRHVLRYDFTHPSFKVGSRLFPGWLPKLFSQH